MGRKSTTGGVSPLGATRIQLYFRLQGKKCRPTLDMKPTPPNLVYARRLVENIETRIARGTFDLAKEFPSYKGLERFGTARPVAKTFKEYGELWLGTKGKLSPSTRGGYEKVLKAHWYRWFGEKLIGSILPSDVRAKMGELPGSRKTHNNVLDPGRQVFELARADGMIAENPCDGIAFLDLPDPEPDPYDLQEVELILPKMRERWDLDVDMRARTSRVQRARVEGIVKDTKTYYNRTLEHHSRYHAALERQFARTGLAGGYVWLSPFSGNGRKAGEPWLDEHRQGEMFRTVIRLLRMRQRPAKNTRHTYATILLMAGTKPSWAAAQLGHSLDMFLRRYARWIPGGDRGEELAKVEAFTGQIAGQTGGKGRFKAGT